jgi:predicted naringenin-chalcone synthase
MDRFHAEVVPGTQKLITWNVRDQGFDMFLSGRVPEAIASGLRGAKDAILDGASPADIELWALHPGGRSVLDAVDRGLGLGDTALNVSRDVLQAFGNMSSATVMFVLERMLGTSTSGARGCAMALGPGLTAETMLFHKA